MTTKILALTHALGNPVRFRLMPGNRYDSVKAQPLIENIAFDGLFADKAFDSNALVAKLNDRGAQMVISQPSRTGAETHDDRALYIWRSLIENFRKIRELNASPCAPAKPIEASKL